MCEFGTREDNLDSGDEFTERVVVEGDAGWDIADDEETPSPVDTVGVVGEFHLVQGFGYAGTFLDCVAGGYVEWGHEEDVSFEGELRLDEHGWACCLVNDRQELVVRDVGSRVRDVDDDFSVGAAVVGSKEGFCLLGVGFHWGWGGALGVAPTSAYVPLPLPLLTEVLGLVWGLLVGVLELTCLAAFLRARTSLVNCCTMAHVELQVRVSLLTSSLRLLFSAEIFIIIFWVWAFWAEMDLRWYSIRFMPSPSLETSASIL